MATYAKEFLKRFVGLALMAAIVLGIIGTSLQLLIAVAVIVFIAASYTTHKTVSEKTNQELTKKIDNLNHENTELSIALDQAQEDESLWKQTLLERTSGFPSLMTRMQEYEKIKDEQFARFLSDKKHPAYKAADLLRIESGRRREAEFIRKRTEAIIEYYEFLAPFLRDVRDDVSVDLDQESIFGDFTEEELEDRAVKYLTKEEYRKLPTSERNQLALDRFWKRPDKSNWLLGKLYERYVGYLYEIAGYDVEYHGIQKRLEDLGIDLICRKETETSLVQCKNWSQFKTIYEKHIFQFVNSR